MRANRRGSFVYTERGAGAARVAPRPFIVKPDDETVLTSSAPTSFRRFEPPKPEPLCPHGGISIAGKMICIECLREKVTDKSQLADAEHDLFGVAILAICKKAALKHKLISVSVSDCMMTAALELAHPKNRKCIVTAKNPEAMAYTIAARAIQKLYRIKSVIALPVGQMDFGNEHSNDKDFSVTSRLDFLDGKMRTQMSDRAQYNQAALIAEEQSEWAQECYERARVFPGIKLLWNDENLRRLRIVLDEARRLLPTTPYSHSLVVDMKIGYGEQMREHTWWEIAEQVSPSWKAVTIDQVRYAYEKAIATMKAHLLSKLLPVPDKITTDK